jgi:tetratricopeptide (TPR) repeat protein
MTPCRLVLGFCASVLVCWPLQAEPPAKKPASAPLPLCRLGPAKLIPNLCLVKYRVSTSSPECQAFFDQGLGYLYSYVWMEAARSFETAARHDPDCAMAWWGLSRALDAWGRPNGNEALKKAQALLPGASDRERLLIKARLQEKGLVPELKTRDARVKAAIGTIEQLLALYDDDEEGWYYRALLACDGRLFGGNAASAPFFHALLRINPLHPAANHELVHFYEGFTRPALGWPFAEKYIESSPGIPHAFHMQAHLATRLGRWDKTTDRSLHAIELERAYHKQMGVAPRDDAQFSHHLEVLMLGLLHDGRFEEANQLKKECEGYGFEHRLPWFRLCLAERNYDAALKLAERYRKSDKAMASYLRALVYLAREDPARAVPEVDVVQQAYQAKRKNRGLELNLWETQGLLLCEQGAVDAGLKLLARTVERTKDDYGHHSWGRGADYMETWGIAALRAGRLDVAEEAFLEALAHDPGCARAALGLEVLCERQGRSTEASRYAELAHRCWRRASPETFQAELNYLRGQPRGTAAQSTQR